MACEFVKELSSLQKHSSKSVANYNDNLDKNSLYLHVDSPLQSDLVNLLERESDTPGKSLILLCGSAGDGKSHLLSYLAQNRSYLLKKFTVINDATESDGPYRTAPQTLATRLAAFSDSSLEDGGKEKAVVAINLGLLSRFLESESGSSFEELRKYVKNSHLLGTELSNCNKKDEGVFHALDFSNYQNFTIENGQIKTDFLDRLFERVFEPSEANPFFYKWKNECEDECECGGYCPVKHNYEFLREPRVRNVVIGLLVKVNLYERCAIPTRSILNFIYEIVVAPGFSKQKLSNERLGNSSKLFSEYLAETTPQLLFTSLDSDQVLGKLKGLDPCRKNSDEFDYQAIELQLSAKYPDEFKRILDKTTYFNETTQITTDSALDKLVLSGFKKELHEFVVRCSYLTDFENEDEAFSEERDCFKEFVSYLYDSNKGDAMKMKGFGKSFLDGAIKGWNGAYPSGRILVKTYGDIQLLQSITIYFDSPKKGKLESVDSLEFRPFICVEASLDRKKFVEFKIDYSLFRMFKEMGNGYQPTLADKSRFKDFESSYEQLMSQSSKGVECFITRKSIGKRPFAKIGFDEDCFFDCQGVE